MKDAEFARIDEIMQKTPSTSKVTRLDLAKLFLKDHPSLAAIMIEDWLGNNYKTWYSFHKKTAKDGYRFDPSRAQADALRRMVTEGHTIGPIHGKFRWLDGNDVFLSKRTVEVMFQEGWIERISPTHNFVEYEFTVSEVGRKALERLDLVTY